MIKFFKKNKKIIIVGIISFVITFSAISIVYGYDKTNSWQIGNGWIWIKKIGVETRANVENPLDGSNIANMDYVISAMGGSSGGINDSQNPVKCTSYTCGKTGQCGVVCCIPRPTNDGSSVSVDCKTYTGADGWNGNSVSW